MPEAPAQGTRSSRAQKDAEYRTEHERVERRDLEKPSLKSPSNGERCEHAERKAEDDRPHAPTQDESRFRDGTK